MKNYNFEYQYKDYKQKQREYKVPIKMNITNEQYKQQQIEILRELYPNGLNKRIK